MESSEVTKRLVICILATDNQGGTVYWDPTLLAFSENLPEDANATEEELSQVIATYAGPHTDLRRGPVVLLK